MSLVSEMSKSIWVRVPKAASSSLYDVIHKDVRFLGLKHGNNDHEPIYEIMGRMGDISKYLVVANIREPLAWAKSVFWKAYRSHPDSSVIPHHRAIHFNEAVEEFANNFKTPQASWIVDTKGVVRADIIWRVETDFPKLCKTWNIDVPQKNVTATSDRASQDYRPFEWTESQAEALRKNLAVDLSDLIRGQETGIDPRVVTPFTIWPVAEEAAAA